MNVDTVGKKTISITTGDFVKYKNVLDLFKIMYNIYKMVNAQKHLNYCYCNQKKANAGCVNLVNT